MAWAGLTVGFTEAYLETESSGMVLVLGSLGTLLVLGQAFSLSPQRTAWHWNGPDALIYRDGAGPEVSRGWPGTRVY